LDSSSKFANPPADVSTKCRCFGWYRALWWGTMVQVCVVL